MADVSITQIAPMIDMWTFLNIFSFALPSLQVVPGKTWIFRNKWTYRASVFLFCKGAYVASRVNPSIISALSSFLSQITFPSCKVHEVNRPFAYMIKAWCCKTGCCIFDGCRVLIWKSSGMWLAKSISWIVNGKRIRKPTTSSEYASVFSVSVCLSY